MSGKNPDDWIRDFYPVPAHQCKPKDALAATRLKWRGLPAAVLKQYGLRLSMSVLYDAASGKWILSIDTFSCALCLAHSCTECPLCQARAGYACTEIMPGETRSPFDAWLESADPEPMLRWLDRAIEAEERKEK